ncbi:DUF433 domain-containing protein [Candidatus Sumerlaeota bacterium]|nr:DUF433 domain-containing protein [Candidatus Sumerlaeota bacterium]MBI3736935.1 DUF433 domain-containing protein [Candidatus Sumerlaeota bacterium]
MPDVVAQYIVKTLGTCGGKARIADHRIRVQDIVLWHEQMGMSADQIISEHPGITHAEVYAALAYYFDHREEIERELREDAELIDRYRNSISSGSKDLPQ